MLPVGVPQITVSRSKGFHTNFFPLFRMVQTVFQLKETAAVAIYGVLNFGNGIFSKVKGKRWAKNIDTTRNRFHGHFCTKTISTKFLPILLLKPVCQRVTQIGENSAR